VAATATAAVTQTVKRIGLRGKCSLRAASRGI
jgi:hypothetical protein